MSSLPRALSSLGRSQQQHYSLHVFFDSEAVVVVIFTRVPRGSHSHSVFCFGLVVVIFSRDPGGSASVFTGPQGSDSVFYSLI